MLLDPVGEVDLLEETEPGVMGDFDLDIDLCELMFLLVLTLGRAFCFSSRRMFCLALTCTGIPDIFLRSTCTLVLQSASGSIAAEARCLVGEAAVLIKSDCGMGFLVVEWWWY